MATYLLEIFKRFKEPIYYEGIIMGVVICLGILSLSALSDNNLTIIKKIDGYSIEAQKSISIGDKIKTSEGNEEEYRFYVEEFDSSCIQKLTVQDTRKGSEFGIVVCTGEYVDLPTKRVKIGLLSPKSKKPISIEIYEKIIISWRLIFLIAIVLLSLLWLYTTMKSKRDTIIKNNLKIDILDNHYDWKTNKFVYKIFATSTDEKNKTIKDIITKNPFLVPKPKLIIDNIQKEFEPVIIKPEGTYFTLFYNTNIMITFKKMAGKFKLKDIEEMFKYPLCFIDNKDKNIIVYTTENIIKQKESIKKLGEQLNKIKS